MKLGIFTDSHYSSKEVSCGNRYNSKSLNKIKDAYKFFERENCDLVVCLGDLIDTEDSHQKEINNLQKVAEIICNSPLKTFCVMGNHDAFRFTPEEFYGILRGCKPSDMFVDGKWLLFLDTCYFKSGIHYAPGDSDYTDIFYPHVKELEQKLSSLSGDVFVFLHQNIDVSIGDNHCVYNADELNAIFQKSQKVKTVYQGHYHNGKKTIYNNINYITFPAMCENENAYFIEEI